MEHSIGEADYVLVVCTPSYARKADARIGGVGYEATVVTPELAGKINQLKFVPVLREGDWEESVPRWLKTRLGIDLRGEPYDERAYADLLRHIHAAHHEPPSIGPRPSFLVARHRPILPMHWE
jgi:hypothetical protein